MREETSRVWNRTHEIVDYNLDVQWEVHRE